MISFLLDGNLKGFGLLRFDEFLGIKSAAA